MGGWRGCSTAGVGGVGVGERTGSELIETALLIEI